jgi:hypothetical protein
MWRLHTPTHTHTLTHHTTFAHTHARSIAEVNFAAPVAAAPSSSSNSEYGFAPPTLDTVDAFTADASKMAAWEKWVEGKGNLDKWEKSLS